MAETIESTDDALARICAGPTKKIPKVIVFSQFRRALDLFSIHLQVNEGFNPDQIFHLSGDIDMDQELRSSGDSRHMRALVV